MNRLDAPAIDELLDEIRHYLDALDVFRHEGCEPRWSDAPVPEGVLL